LFRISDFGFRIFIVMRIVDLIHAKRHGRPAAAGDIRRLVEDYTSGKIPDYQVAAWLMAVCFRGLDDAELAALTDAMMRSGEVFDLSKIDGVKADKHSTGGVGDKVSLVLAPLAAACGLRVPMISGRGLGHTGGTLDKLESIPGFNVNLSGAQFRRQLARLGVAMIGQTDRFVPADKKMYALRDVTATVESIPLIAASIMSKKLAEGCEALVLDVKVGNGAFMADRRRATDLARTMIAIGRRMGRRVAALLTDMNQPTGRAIGNANEVIEAIECLKGGGPDDLRRVTLALTERMLTLGGLAGTRVAAAALIRRALDSGAALELFRKTIEAQGGDPRVIDDTRRLRLAPKDGVVLAPRAGWLSNIQTRQVGIAAAILGAGRQTTDDRIDCGVGLWYESRLGEKLEKGQSIFRARYRKAAAWAEAERLLAAALTLTEERTPPPRLILGTIDE
jgi:pyrimidine-nucleoside phosphorylase